LESLETEKKGRIKTEKFMGDFCKSRKTLSKIINEHGAVTPDMALRLSRAFDTTPELWLNLQKKL